MEKHTACKPWITKQNTKKNMQENFLLNFKLFRITVETFDGKMILHE